jgi:lipid-A-disaccharide synthase
VQFFEKHGLVAERPVVALLPGSRRGEAARHMPALAEAAAQIARQTPVSFVVALPTGRFVGTALPE